MDFLPSAFAAMSQYRQFICYKLTPSTKRIGKNDKRPCDHRSGSVSDLTNPGIWTDHDTAIAAAKRLGSQFGVGFVFAESDPFWFLDIDNCYIDGKWSDLSQRLIAMFPNAALEVSSSGSGLHIFGTGIVPEHGKRNAGLGLEFYTEARFVALTGTHARGDAGFDCSAVLPQFVADFFPAGGTNGVGRGDLETQWAAAVEAGVAPEWFGPDDDDALLALASRVSSAAVAFAQPGEQDKATFADLWERRVDVLAKAYPDSGERPYDESKADASLAFRLAFYTGKDCARILRLIERSGLKRDKYDRPDYLKRTILNAVANQVNVMQAKRAEPMPTGSAAAIEDSPRALPTTGETFLNPTHQMELFAGCVYVAESNAVLVPGGVMKKPDQFKVHFGGFSFMMDNRSERTSRDAYEAFTQSQAFRSPRAEALCFRPTLPPAAIINEGGRVYANVWWPIETPRMKGDPAPFLAHIAKLLPDPRDQKILISYMCAVVQHKGVKFQWAPLIQGAPGNGKTLLSKCVFNAIGSKYAWWVNAKKIGEKFNSWLLNKLFYGVEDISVSDKDIDVIEVIKPMITGDEIEIEAKGADQITAKVCGNFIFNTNHKTGLRKTRDDRRFAVFYTHQQSVDDIVRDGMGGEYFPALYDWLNADGYAIVTEFLSTHPIPDEFNPATACHRAPITSSTKAAITESQGVVEQEIVEAIEATSTPGFLDGWVSSMQLDKLLKDINRRIPRNKRDDLMESLGYVPHPALAANRGRVNNPVMPDGGRPRLYIKRDHPGYHLPTPAAVATAYSAAQMTGVGFGAPLPQGVK